MQLIIILATVVAAVLGLPRSQGVGPVYTFNKTDPQANFQWGHRAGAQRGEVFLIPLCALTHLSIIERGRASGVQASQGGLL